MENNEKKMYEEPVVEKVEFNFSDRITASGCGAQSTYLN